MAWNNGYERKKFESEQKRLAEEYRAAGMTEEQIEEMYQFDLTEFRSRRRFWKRYLKERNCQLHFPMSEKKEKYYIL